MSRHQARKAARSRARLEHYERHRPAFAPRPHGGMAVRCACGWGAHGVDKEEARAAHRAHVQAARAEETR